MAAAASTAATADWSSPPPASREDSFVNSRGQRIATMCWLPPSATPVRGLLFIVHGYGHYGRGLGGYMSFMAAHGMAVYSLDHHGHGHSEGLRCYVESFQHLVDDVVAYVTAVQASYGAACPRSFICSQSMGGAVAFLATCPGAPLADRIAGTVFVCPMVKIADAMRPADWQISSLSWLAYVVPTWPIVPVADVLDKAFKDPVAREEARSDPLGYHGRPRVRTALELFLATQRISAMLDQYHLPFLLLQGDADQVTDPQISIDFHTAAASPDKTLKLYPGFWHAIFREPDNGAQLAQNDVRDWLLQRL
eukprot:m.212241 g.212241  ORF g.212241 m.212241 type:complete len:308 (+) comp19925_c0_seq1:241-1164(+)